MFSSKALRAKPGTILDKDPLRTVELGISFKRITCHRCDFTSIYKYRVKEIRRSAALTEEEEKGVVPSISDEQREAWKRIPRYAQIPETVKCKRCGEVLGLYIDCIY